MAYNDLLLSTKVLMTLMKPLFNKRYCLTIDNYHTSPQLANILVKNHTDMHETVRLNHIKPASWNKKKNIKKGSFCLQKEKNNNVEID